MYFIVHTLREMVTGLRLEDRLDGAGNFVPWKARIVLILEENELWDEVVHSTQANPIQVHASTDAQALATFNKKYIKARRIIFDAVKDHVIPHISGKDHAFKMWNVLARLYESSNENRKMVLRQQLRETKMTKTENVSSYLTRISQVCDELGVVGKKVDDAELVRVALNGFCQPLHDFVCAVVARENFPSWARLWSDFTQEKLRSSSTSTSQQK